MINPECDECGHEFIQEEMAYKIGDKLYCQNCIDDCIVFIDVYDGNDE